MKNKYIYIPLFCVCLSSCHKPNVTEVHPVSEGYADSTQVLLVEDRYPSMQLVTDKAIHLQVKEEISKDFNPKTHIRYLPLETTGECLIGQIDKMESDESSIFIFDRDNNSILRFSQKDGSFLNRFGSSGRGPGEYIEIIDASVDKERKEVCLLDFTLFKLLFFDYDGMFLREEPFFYYYNAIEFLGDKRIINTGFNSNAEAPYINGNRIVLTEADQTPLYTGFAYPQYFLDNFHQGSKHDFLTCDKEVYYNHVLSDTIWQIKDNGVCEARYVFKFPGRDNLYDEKDFQGITDDDYRNKQKDIPFYRDELAITKDFVKADIYGAPGLLYCKSTGHCFTGFPRYKTFGKPTTSSADFTLNDQSFVIPLQPFQIIKETNMIKGIVTEEQFNHMLANQYTEEERQLLSTMTEEDNPILMIMDIEPF